jgi:Trk K+ transport system NAD-binding subunit
LIGAALHEVADDVETVDSENPPGEGDQYLAEIVITNDSPLHRRTLSEVSFGSRRPTRDPFDCTRGTSCWCRALDGRWTS